GLCIRRPGPPFCGYAAAAIGPFSGGALNVSERQGITLWQRVEFQLLQALEDAIAHRTVRLAAWGPDCGHLLGDQRCDEHTRDLELMDEYRATVASTRLA